jgi:hypothetical protein
MFVGVMLQGHLVANIWVEDGNERIADWPQVQEDERSQWILLPDPRGIN